MHFKLTMNANEYFISDSQDTKRNSYCNLLGLVIQVIMVTSNPTMLSQDVSRDVRGYPPRFHWIWWTYHDATKSDKTSHIWHISMWQHDCTSNPSVWHINGNVTGYNVTCCHVTKRLQWMWQDTIDRTRQWHGYSPGYQGCDPYLYLWTCRCGWKGFMIIHGYEYYEYICHSYKYLMAR